MKFHGITLVGPLVHQIVTTLPTWTSADIGRQVYNQLDGKFYLADSTGWVAIGSGSGSSGVGDVQINPNDFLFDEDLPGCDAGVAFGLSECIDFRPDLNGAVVANFLFPSSWDITKDIRFKLEYSLNGTDNSKNVKVNVSYWVLNTNATPSVGSPTESELTEFILSDSTNTGKTAEAVLSTCKVSTSYLTANTKSIVIKFTRDASHGSDTYGGTFQLLKVTAYQE